MPENQPAKPGLGNMIVKRRKYLIVMAAFCLLGGTFLVRGNAAVPNTIPAISGKNRPPSTAQSQLDGASADLTSGQAMPRGDIAGWQQLVAEDFSVKAAVGSWAKGCEVDKVAYVGLNGTKWTTIPGCSENSAGKRQYRPGDVLSVHDGVLDFELKSVDGQPVGAAVVPFIKTDLPYQTHGRYEVRLRVDTANLSEYSLSASLVPQDKADVHCAESSFPVGRLNSEVGGSYYAGCNSQLRTIGTTARFTDWHTYTQEWSPSYQKYYLDGKLIATSTGQTYAKPQRWQLQAIAGAMGNHTGSLLVDWVVVYTPK